VFTTKKALATTVGAVGMAALVAVVGLGSPAMADPTAAGASYCAAGSDTTQDVVQKLASTVVTSAATGSKTFESWDAVGTSPITTHCATGSLYRPNGSSDGITALRLAQGLNTGSDGYSYTDAYVAAHGAVPAGALTIARSSRKPRDTSDTSLTWIPFGTDAVDYAVNTGGALDQAYPGGLTIAQLQAIYACTRSSRTFRSPAPAPGRSSRARSASQTAP
jgi:hypothetical protein